MRNENIAPNFKPELDSNPFVKADQMSPEDDEELP